MTPPNSAGGVFAIRIGDSFPYVIVEARRKSDQFETGMPLPYEMGITSEGVIAYRVQIRNATVNEREGHKAPLYLMTQTALHSGESMLLDDGVKLIVTTELPKGFIVRLFDT